MFLSAGTITIYSGTSLSIQVSKTYVSPLIKYGPPTFCSTTGGLYAPCIATLVKMFET